MGKNADILYIEDDTDLRDTMAELLELRGYAVRTANHGKEGLEMLREGVRPDVVLLDLMMPVMSGWELRREMLSDPELAAIPTVLVSGVHDAGQHVSDLDAWACLKKPIDVDRLISVLGEAQPMA